MDRGQGGDAGSGGSRTHRLETGVGAKQTLPPPSPTVHQKPNIWGRDIVVQEHRFPRKPHTLQTTRVRLNVAGLTFTVALAVVGPPWKSSPPFILSLSHIWTR